MYQFCGVNICLYTNSTKFLRPSREKLKLIRHVRHSYALVPDNTNAHSKMNVSLPSKKTATVKLVRPSCDEVYAKDMACVRDPAPHVSAMNRDCIRVYYSYDLCQYLRGKGEAVVTVRRAGS